jgi:hypothetical protein
MREKVIKNVEASIRAKLLNYAKTTGENYNAVLNRFFQERFLARLSETKYKQHFVLKGGLLLLTEHVSKFRPTIDILFLASNNRFSSGKLRKAIETTFHKRETDIARCLFIYRNQYIELKSGLWQIFLRKIQPFCLIQGTLKFLDIDTLASSIQVGKKWRSRLFRTRITSLFSLKAIN